MNHARALELCYGIFCLLRDSMMNWAEIGKLNVKRRSNTSCDGKRGKNLNLVIIDVVLSSRVQGKVMRCRMMGDLEWLLVVVVQLGET